MTYIPINDCFTCLEQYLMYVDFGMSEASSSFLAGLFHVTEEKGTQEHFAVLAQEFLKGRVDPQTNT
jgi:hypothetical protein